MVRLKVCRRAVLSQPLLAFQFKYGAIKSDYELYGFIVAYEFQFQYGAIKRFENAAQSAPSLMFQFQYGAIKRMSIFCVSQD